MIEFFPKIKYPLFVWQIFCSLACMAKATVQAALGPVILRRLTNDTNNFSKDEKRYADIIQLVCILSIVVTAPIGAILISITGPRLLTKTKPMQNVEGDALFLNGFLKEQCNG